MQFMENISFLFIIELKLEMNYNYKNSSIRLTIYIVIFELEYVSRILFFVLGKKNNRDTRINLISHFETVGITQS